MRIHVHALATAAATLALMVMGSLVHGTGSSLACPDWPLCHGSFFPEMTHGVEFEHTHRLMAAGVVVLIVSLFWRTLKGQDRLARWLAGAGCALVLVQATLGGLTVIYRLPPAISIAHLATSMAFLSLMVIVAARLWPGKPPTEEPAHGRFGSVALLAFVQIVLGAAVRHTGAVLACTGFPLCSGELWPDASLSRLHVLHRTLGLLVLVATIAVCLPAARRAETRARLVTAVLPMVACTLQIALGIAIVLTYAPLDLVTLHHLGGGVLLGSLVLAWAARNPLQVRDARGVFGALPR